MMRENDPMALQNANGNKAYNKVWVHFLFTSLQQKSEKFKILDVDLF